MKALVEVSLKRLYFTQGEDRVPRGAADSAFMFKGGKDQSDPKAIWK